MLLELDVEGFRSLKSVKWTPGPISVFIGPNASGKSNLLRAMQLLSASARGELSETIRREGGFDAILWPNAPYLRLSSTLAPSPPYYSHEHALRYDLVLVRVGSTRFRIEYERLSNRAGMTSLTRDATGAFVYSINAQSFTAPVSALDETETLLSSVTGPLAVGLNQFVTSYRERLADWTVYQNFWSGLDASVRRPQVASSDSRLDADGQNLVAVLHALYETDQGFESDLNDAMRAAFGGEFQRLRFPPAGDQRVQLRSIWEGAAPATSMPDLSDGTVRFLYLVAALANPRRPSLVAIDEPETGLHPTMLGVVADLARNASSSSQVILATHSPELLETLGTDDPPPTTVIFDRRDGETVLRTLDREGLASWLKRYSMGDMFRTGELEAME